MAKKTAGGGSRSKSRKSGVTPVENREGEDRISRYLDSLNLVPVQFQSTDQLLDIVSWNIRFFDHRDQDRVEHITNVMQAINADVFVLTEIAKDGALEEVVDKLAERKAGYYSTFYGDLGVSQTREQRVVIMWDRDWVRAKNPPANLFADAGVIEAENGFRKEIFPRLPVWAYFEARGKGVDNKPAQDFAFEIAGVHLKSMMADRGYIGDQKFGTNQRRRAAEMLAEWLESPENHFDPDILIVGDWNQKPDAPEWEPFTKLEREGKLAFRSINKGDEVSHIARLNKKGPGGTRLDLQLVRNPEDLRAVKGEQGVVIQWSFFEKLKDLDRDTLKLVNKKMREEYSDHLPIVSRFYFA